MTKTTQLPGIAEWFRVGEIERVEKAAEIISRLKIKEFRILFSWADWETEKGPEWFDYHINRLASTGVKLIPDLFYTPINKARANPHGDKLTSHPPLDTSEYARFVEEMIKRYGQHFDWVQIWNEPNWKPYWEWDLDPDAKIFSEMGIKATDVIHEYGKKAALGGLSPYEPEWITLIHKHGLLPKLDAIGIHYSPSWDDHRRKWFGWEAEIDTARAHLKGLGSKAEVWIAQTGYATIGAHEKDIIEADENQIEYFDSVITAPADKKIWFSIFNQPKANKTDKELNMMSRIEMAAYNFGIIDYAGQPKPLFIHWEKMTA